MYKIGCVIVTYNPNNNFKEVLEQITKQVDNIVIVDNGSKVNIGQYINEYNNIKLIQLNENKGIAYALNRGIEICIEENDDWILTLDHDSIATDGMLKKMIGKYNDFNEKIKSQIAMIVPKHIEESSKINAIEDSSYEFVLTEITSGSLVKTEVYRDRRKYIEKLFIDLVDHEFCLYLSEENLKILKVNSAILLHNLGESKSYKILGKVITPTNHSPIRRYYMSRNRIYIWKKYKNSSPKWIKKDKKKFISENIKILIFEKQKMKKFKMIFKGIYEGKRFEEKICK